MLLFSIDLSISLALAVLMVNDFSCAYGQGLLLSSSYQEHELGCPYNVYSTLCGFLFPFGTISGELNKDDGWGKSESSELVDTGISVDSYSFDSGSRISSQSIDTASTGIVSSVTAHTRLSRGIQSLTLMMTHRRRRCWLCGWLLPQEYCYGAICQMAHRGIYWLIIFCVLHP